MKRRHVHGLFTAAVLVSGALALANAWQWQQALRVNQSVADAALTPPAPDAAGEAQPRSSARWGVL